MPSARSRPRNAGRNTHTQGRRGRSYRSRARIYRRRPARDPTKPRRPKNAYLMWFTDNRSNIQQDPMQHPRMVARRAGELWRRMSSPDKLSWYQRAAEDKKRYETEMKQWHAEQNQTIANRSDYNDESEY